MRLKTTAIALALCLGVTNMARADGTTTPDLHAAQKAAQKAAWAAAAKAAVIGPASVKLLDQAILQIPAGEAFIPQQQAQAIQRAAGNGDDPSVYGMVVSTAHGQDWWDIISWTGDGYVRDGDAKNWQPDSLLQSLRDGTVQENQERARLGIPQLDIIGWVQPPSYDAGTHRLVWSLAARDQGADPAQPEDVNYNTYALGRRGYFSLDMITGSDTIAAANQTAVQLLDNLTYNNGQRYEDFNDSTDHVAAYGLAALIGVVAVKKLGLLAVAGVFLLKIWKIGLLVLVGAGSAIKRKLGIKPKQRPAPLDGQS
jgi:uncharacterized membrane-anchored protein